MMDIFRIRPQTEEDVRSIVEKCGGKVAHPDADRRKDRGGEFVHERAAIELKLLDEDGFEKTERQAKLARIFEPLGSQAPVLLNPERPSIEGRCQYDSAIEGPIRRTPQSVLQLNFGIDGGKGLT